MVNLKRTSRVVFAACVVALAVVSPAAADGWLPHAADATWSYQWTDSVYNTTPSPAAGLESAPSAARTVTALWG